MFVYYLYTNTARSGGTTAVDEAAMTGEGVAIIFSGILILKKYKQVFEIKCNHRQRQETSKSTMFNSRMSVLTPLLVVAIFAVLAPDLYSPIMIEAQRPGSPLTTNNPTNPFGGAYESPPLMVMVYNNTEYLGVLDSYSFRVAETLGEIPIFNDTVVSTIPNQTITVENGSVIRFEIKGNAPPEAQSDALAVNAYTIEGKPVKVLKVADESDRTSFIVDLEPDREYILMAVATWLLQQGFEKISGYVAYSYRINSIS